MGICTKLVIMQQQATKTQEVTKQEALVLVKNMLRISISTICYMRDIFPVDCFKNKQYGTVEIHQLQGAAKQPSTGEFVVSNPEAFLLTQWLEKGVFAALEEEYLASVTFAIFNCPNCKDVGSKLLESYEFKISYDNDSRPKINDVEIQSKETVKAQAAQFIRSLTEFVSTLDVLPVDRWITMQLKYHNAAPNEYEPEFFTRSVTSLLEGQTTPLLVNVGQLVTSKMSMKLKFAGLESLFEEENNRKPVENIIQQSVVPKSNILLVGTVGESETAMSQEMEESPSCENHIVEKVELSNHDAVLEYIKKTNSAIVRHCSIRLNLPEKVVREIFQKLEKEGKLSRKGNHYVIEKHVEITSKQPIIPAIPMNSQCSDSAEMSGNKQSRKYSTIKEPIVLRHKRAKY